MKEQLVNALESPYGSPLPVFVLDGIEVHDDDEFAGIEVHDVTP